jgi:hypothetical protein
MICTLGFSKTNLVQFDAPRMTLCGAITGCDSLENTQFVVVLSSFVISPISGDLLFLSISASLPSWMSCT